MLVFSSGVLLGVEYAGIGEVSLKDGETEWLTLDGVGEVSLKDGETEWLTLDGVGEISLKDGKTEWLTLVVADDTKSFSVLQADTPDT